MAAPADEYNEHILYNVDAHNAWCNLHKVYADNVLPCRTKFIQHSSKHANSGYVYDLNRSYIFFQNFQSFNFFLKATPTQDEQL